MADCAEQKGKMATDLRRSDRHCGLRTTTATLAFLAPAMIRSIMPLMCCPDRDLIPRRCLIPGVLVSDITAAIYLLLLADGADGPPDSLEWEVLTPAGAELAVPDPADIALTDAAQMTISSAVADILAEDTFPPRPGEICRNCPKRDQAVRDAPTGYDGTGVPDRMLMPHSLVSTVGLRASFGSIGSVHRPPT